MTTNYRHIPKHLTGQQKNIELDHKFNLNFFKGALMNYPKVFSLIFAALLISNVTIKVNAAQSTSKPVTSKENVIAAAETCAFASACTVKKAKALLREGYPYLLLGAYTYWIEPLIKDVTFWPAEQTQKNVAATSYINVLAKVLLGTMVIRHAQRHAKVLDNEIRSLLSLEETAAIPA